MQWNSVTLTNRKAIEKYVNSNFVYINIDQEHAKGETERFLINQNKTECKFSRESSSSSYEQHKTK